METNAASDSLVIAVCVAYGIAAWLVQMARVMPPRDWLLERIDAFRVTIADADWVNRDAVERDLASVEASLARGKWLPWFRVPISSVQAGWRNIHGLEDDYLLGLSAPLVEERLRTALTRLSGMSGDAAKAMAARVENVLAPPPGERRLEAAREAVARLAGPEAARTIGRVEETFSGTTQLERRRAVLREAEVFRHGVNDSNYEDRAALLGKAVWLTAAALGFVVLIALAFDRETYFLLGAAGALISRLTRVLERRPSASDYGAEWSTLLLTPAAGALAGWVTVLLTGVLAEAPFDVLDDRFGAAWDDVANRLGLVVAFFGGFSERLFNRLLGYADQQVGGRVVPKAES